MPGYSGTPLARKLGIKAGQKMFLCNEPATYRELVGELLEGNRILKRLGKSPVDFIHAFFTSECDLLSRLPKLKSSLATDGILWISWPKKTSGIQSDLTRDAIRETVLQAGLVDIKVCAVTDEWSALKFVYRVKDR